MRTRKFWTPADDQIMIDLYPHKSSEYLAKLLKRTLSSVYGRAGFLDLNKSLEYMETSGTSGRISKGKRVSTGTEFKKGMKPWNTGTKGLTGPNGGTFKKGSKPHNTHYDGKISIRNDSSGRKYKWIRISNAKWEMLHVYMWEKENGITPKGFIIIFIDGDQMNCQLSNFKLISHVQHMEETRDKDGYIASRMAHKKGTKGKIDYELKNELLKHPELIEAKRKQLKLNQIIKTYESKH